MKPSYFAPAHNDATRPAPSLTRLRPTCRCALSIYRAGQASFLAWRTVGRLPGAGLGVRAHAVVSKGASQQQAQPKDILRQWFYKLWNQELRRLMVNGVTLSSPGEVRTGGEGGGSGGRGGGALGAPLLRYLSSGTSSTCSTQG